MLIVRDCSECHPYSNTFDCRLFYTYLFIFQVFFFALMAFAAAKPLIYTAPVAAAYTAPLAAAYTAPVAYSAYSAYSPVAYSAYSYASPYTYYIWE